ncbi:MAG: hypothetical protein OXT09_12440 [Myxococcales bacterium]|nr:hypothetical protein [Myxococcales bacterium]
MGSSPIRALLVASLVALVTVGTASAAGVNGRLVLGAYKPEPPKPKRSPFNWELENGFKQVIPDRVDAARELAVVLVGEGEAPGLDRAEAVFQGGGLLPSTIVARTGATLLVRNEDEVAHEVYAAKLDAFASEAISPRGRRTVKLDAAGDWALADKLIPHVKGHLHVVDNLIAIAKVDASGRFSFADVAPGKYTLKVFHGPKEVGSSAVEVAGTKAITLDPMTLTTGPAEGGGEGAPAEKAK